MENWNDNWGNNNTPSYGQENTSSHDSDDGLDGLLENDSDDGLDGLLENESTDFSQVTNTTGTDSTSQMEEEDTVAAEKNDKEKLVDSFEVAPSSAKNSPVFSERQVYRIINLTSVMDYCKEEDTQVISTIFGVRGKNVRKAMTLAEAETTEIENKIVSVTVLKKILQSATGEGIDDPMDFAIELFSQVSSMDDDQMSAMISLVKSFQDEANEKRIRINRSTPAAEVIKEIKAALEVDDVALAAETTSDVIDLVHEALK